MALYYYKILNDVVVPDYGEVKKGDFVCFEKSPDILLREFLEVRGVVGGGRFELRNLGFEIEKDYIELRISSTGYLRDNFRSSLMSGLAIYDSLKKQEQAEEVVEELPENAGELLFNDVLLGVDTGIIQEYAGENPYKKDVDISDEERFKIAKKRAEARVGKREAVPPVKVSRAKGYVRPGVEIRELDISNAIGFKNVDFENCSLCGKVIIDSYNYNGLICCNLCFNKLKEAEDKKKELVKNTQQVEEKVERFLDF